MLADVLFIQAGRTSRGGLYSDIRVEDKECFVRGIEAWNQRLDETNNTYYSYPDCRYVFLNSTGAEKFKSMTVVEFEAIFSEEDRGRLGRLLEYGRLGNTWPVFRKDVYLKHGHEFKGDN